MVGLFNISHFYDGQNFDSDPEVIRRFARLRFDKILADILRSAMLEGYVPKNPIS